MNADPVDLPRRWPKPRCTAVHRCFLGGCLALLVESVTCLRPSAALAAPPATAERGFRLRTLQLPATPGSIGAAAPMAADLAWTEAMLGGALGPLTANPLLFSETGFYHESGTINYSAPLPFLPEIFQGNLAGDATFPGLPSFGSSSYDNTAIEITTFLAFDAPGTYRFGLHADNLFKLSVGHSPPPSLISVLSPDAIAGPLAAVPSVRDDSQATGIFGRLPARAVEGNVVAAVGTATNATALQGCGEHWANAQEVAGQIALVDRGGCSFVEKIRNAANAGAAAVLVANDRPDPPIIMGGVPNDLALPALMIRQSDGLRLKSNPGARLRWSAAPPNAVAVNTRPSDPFPTSFALHIGSPGFYPVRLVTQVPTSPATLEWTVSITETEVFLLNDPAMDDRSSVRAYSTAPPLPEPAISLHREGAGFILRYVGVLQSANDPTGPFTDEPAAPISGAASVDSLIGGSFFRARW